MIYRVLDKDKSKLYFINLSMIRQQESIHKEPRNFANVSPPFPYIHF